MNDDRTYFVGHEYENFMRWTMKSPVAGKYSAGDLTYPLGIERGEHRAIGISYNKAMKDLRGRLKRAAMKIAASKKLTDTERVIVERCMERIDREQSQASDMLECVRALFPIIKRISPQR